jgi:hypothetical protein
MLEVIYFVVFKELKMQILEIFGSGKKEGF